MNLGPAEIFSLLAICAIATAVIFSRKGRNAAAGFFVGLILGPAGVAVALILSPLPRPGANRFDPSG